MISKIKKLSTRSHICETSNKTDVRPGLSYTPAQMAEMVSRGIPVSNFTSEQFDDGTSSRQFEDLLLENTRGVDINDAWNAQQDARKKFRAAHQNDINTYGE